MQAETPDDTSSAHKYRVSSRSLIHIITFKAGPSEVLHESTVFKIKKCINRNAVANI